MNPNPNPNEPAAMPPAGWYADPLAVADLRWWSGTGWTESTHNVVEGPEPEPEQEPVQVPDPEPGPLQEPEPMQEPEPKPVRGDWEMRKPFKVMGVIILALIALAAAVGVLGAMGVIEEEKQAASAPEPAAIPAAPDAGSSARADVADWASDVATWSSGMASALSEVSSLIQQGAYADLAVPLATISLCSDTFPTAPSGSAAVSRIEQDILEACDHFERGATLVARGIDEVDAATISKANDEWVIANAKIKAASRKITALSG